MVAYVQVSTRDILAVLQFPQKMLKQHISSEAWTSDRLASLILGHKRGLCLRTAGLFKTGLSLIGHTSLSLSRLQARQLIREAEQCMSFTTQQTPKSLYNKENEYFLNTHTLKTLHLCFYWCLQIRRTQNSLLPKKSGYVFCTSKPHQDQW